jgi:hypothetical protein
MAIKNMAASVLTRLKNQSKWQGSGNNGGIIDDFISGRWTIVL